ncbi:hypothetical protein MYCTH_2297404 [Thermothelomyces thermophilus ATCC 42464]|uniref:Uncharacterized protein n=1 Tax=Thermothelomyces thermophilus (strain ATCC 42464 / BCRC 31852 / DSM 1799) TaxID=573729 RepID=G2Q5K2_THET4|nr:uncharacterized protein MYCTH_2297404 [Thermothelomyces thermophilus ATCC 42464]AEO54635.1 hypothetical protein MYCTH_2297404 [Thermothelomyces thermophilus ATCC 42464]
MHGNTSFSDTLLLAEANFGPSAKDRFDFTLTFENAILSIIPSAIFCILAPHRLYLLWRQPHKVAKSPRHVFKLVCMEL